MKLDCDVIRDLLPLYVEQLASPASTALVEEHLRECSSCRAELEQMQLPVPVRQEPQPEALLQKIKLTLRKRSIRVGVKAVLATLCAAALVFWMGSIRVPVTAEEAGFWNYSKKEEGARLCVLEVQGENVRLETVGEQGWGQPSITVRAVRYAFPRLHTALAGLVGTDAAATSIVVSRVQSLTVVCADGMRFYRDNQQVERYIVEEEPDGTLIYAYGTEQVYGGSYEKG